MCWALESASYELDSEESDHEAGYSTKVSIDGSEGERLSLLDEKLPRSLSSFLRAQMAAHVGLPVNFTGTPNQA